MSAHLALGLAIWFEGSVLFDIGVGCYLAWREERNR